MTNEEAIEILQEERDWAQQLSYVNKALDIAKDAIKKQIAQKPKIIDAGNTFIWKCPTCDKSLNPFSYFSTYQSFGFKPDVKTYTPTHCVCGQKIDWS